MDLVKVIEETLKNLEHVNVTNKVKAQAILDALTDATVEKTQLIFKRDKQ